MRVAWPSEPLHHIRHRSIEVIFTVKSHAKIAARPPQFGDSAGALGETLPQLVLGPPIQPQDCAEGGVVTTSEVDSQLRLADAAEAI